MTRRRAKATPRTTRSGQAARRQRTPTPPLERPGDMPPGPGEEEDILQRELDAVLEEERQLREAAERNEQLAQARVNLHLARERVARLREGVGPESTLSDSASRAPSSLLAGNIPPAPAASTTAARKTLVHPDKYKGRNLKEFKIFTYKCEINFRRDPVQFATDELQILYAVSLCEGEPLDRWREHESTLHL